MVKLCDRRRKLFMTPRGAKDSQGNTANQLGIKPAESATSRQRHKVDKTSKILDFNILVLARQRTLPATPPLVAC